VKSGEFPESGVLSVESGVKDTNSTLHSPHFTLTKHSTLNTPLYLKHHSNTVQNALGLI